LIAGLAGRADIRMMYGYIFDHITSEYNKSEHLAATQVFGILRCALVSLTEQEIREICGRLVTVSAIEWAHIRTLFEQFGLIRGDYWNMRSAQVGRFADGIVSSAQLKQIQNALGDFMLGKLRADSRDVHRITEIREKTAFAKAALHHYRMAGEHEKLLCVLEDGEALSYLAKLEWQAVRTSWAELLLYSETDVADRLFALIKRHKSGLGDGRIITNKLAELFSDLELRSHLGMVCAMTGREHITGSFVPDFSEASSEFIDIYNGLCRIKESGDFRKLYEQSQRYLEMRELKPIEKSSLYFFKADAEEHLGLYRDYLDTVNLYYRCSVAASSDFDLRRAFSM